MQPCKMFGDAQFLFVARGARMFAFGGLAVVLMLLLEEQGLKTTQIGSLFTIILLGDLVITLVLTTSADR